MILFLGKLSDAPSSKKSKLDIGDNLKITTQLSPSSKPSMKSPLPNIDMSTNNPLKWTVTEVKQNLTLKIFSSSESVVSLSVTLNSALSFKARDLKLCTQTLHINAKKVTKGISRGCDMGVGGWVF